MCELPEKFYKPEYRNVLVVAGAGMSADSGIPTFQNRANRFEFWGTAPESPARRVLKEGLSFLKILRIHPELAWPIYLHRLELCLKARIHGGYHALAEIARLRNRTIAILTSNVDGFFQRAGFSSVHECHGKIRRLQCSTPCRQETWEADADQIRQDLSTGVFPVCLWCGGAARPNVSWGETYFASAEGDVRARQLANAVEAMVAEPTLLIECGVSEQSGLRRYAKNLHQTHRTVFLLRINTEAEIMESDRQWTLRGTVEQTLIALQGKV